MAGRKTAARTEKWWATLAPPTAVRCEAHVQSGARCRREAILGSTVCRQHGGAAKQVRERAAARIGNAADEMVMRLHSMLDDPNVDARDKIKIAQDMLDRAGLNATGKLLVGMVEVDPVEALFQKILSDPNATYELPSPARGGNERAEVETSPCLDDNSTDIVDAEVIAECEPERKDARTVRKNGTVSENPPPHIRRDLERLGLL